MRKILITGAAGLLGQYLVAKLKNANNILCLDIEPKPFPESDNVVYRQIDLLEFALWKKEAADFKPDMIINCAAYSDVDACEVNRELADRANIELVENLMELPFGMLIHYSSDYVFDGESGPYKETDLPRPINYYGKTKLESERLLLKASKNYLIVRTNVLYGTGINLRPNFITWLVDGLNNRKTMTIVTDQYNNPTYAESLAEASIEAIDLELSGILHIGGTDYLSRYEAAILTANALNLDSKLIRKSLSEDLSQKAKRPRRGGVDTARARAVLKTRLVGIKEGLAQMYRQGN